MTEAAASASFLALGDERTAPPAATATATAAMGGKPSPSPPFFRCFVAALDPFFIRATFDARAPLPEAGRSLASDATRESASAPPPRRKPPRVAVAPPPRVVVSAAERARAAGGVTYVLPAGIRPLRYVSARFARSDAGSAR